MRRGRSEKIPQKLGTIQLGSRNESPEIRFTPACGCKVGDLFGGGRLVVEEFNPVSIVFSLTETLGRPSGAALRV